MMKSSAVTEVKPPADSPTSAINDQQVQPQDETSRLRHQLQNHINRTSWERETVFMAIASGDVDIARQLIFDRKLINLGVWGGHLLYKAMKSELEAMALFLIHECQVDVKIVNIKNGRTPLMMAAKEGMLEVVRYLINVKGVDAKAKDKSGLDVAAYAALVGSVEVMRFLIEEVEFDIGAKYGTRGNQLVHMVAGGKRADTDYLALFKWLVLEKGADAKAKDSDGCTPLHYAARLGYLPILQFLIDEKRISVGTTATPSENTALHWACEGGHLEVVEWLVDKAGAGIYVRNARGQTPRDFAALKGHHDIVEFLNSWRAKMKARSIINNLLTKTASTGDIEGTKKILQRSDLPQPMHLPWDQSALLVAGKEGQLGLARYLILDMKVDPNFNSPKTCFPLLVASIKKGHDAMALFLIQEAKAEINIPDARGMTPLMWAAQMGMMSVVRCLVLEKGVDIKAKDNEGFDAAFYAAFFNQLDVVSFLVGERGLDVSKVYESGYQLPHFAAAAGRLEILKWLIEVGGVDRKVQVSNGKTLRDIAAEGKHMDIVAYLDEQEGDAPTTATSSVEETLPLFGTFSIVEDNNPATATAFPRNDDGEKEADDGGAVSSRTDGSKAERNRKRMEKKKRSKAKRAAAEAASMGGGEGGVGGQEVEEEASPDRETQVLEGGQAEEGVVEASSGATSTSPTTERAEEAVVMESTTQSTAPTTTGLPSEEEKEEAKVQVVEEEVFDEKAYLLEGAPDDFICPISFDLMTDPVTAMDGFIYDRAAIQKYFNHCHKKGKPLISPLTGLPMNDERLLDAVFARKFIREYIDNKLRQRQQGGGGAT